jgi:GntR family transcriptional regulator/MocR family aminotransferase
MTNGGEVMTMKRRHELIDHALNNNHLIIEDDYQNDFVFSSKPTPSLYAMTGGENTAFLSSFSRVLLPSVRISFLILPKNVRDDYLKIKSYYNQTASLAEQIALAQFIRDGHLYRHIKKIRHYYEDKRLVLKHELKRYFNSSEIYIGDSGMEFGIRLQAEPDEAYLEKCPVKVILVHDREGHRLLLVSCSMIKSEDISPAVRELAKYVL